MKWKLRVFGCLCADNDVEVVDRRRLGFCNNNKVVPSRLLTESTFAKLGTQRTDTLIWYGFVYYMELDVKHLQFLLFLYQYCYKLNFYQYCIVMILLDEVNLFKFKH